MSRKNVIILFTISILFFSLSLVGVYVYAAKPNPGHSWDEMECDSKMCVGNNVGVGTTSPGEKLEVSGHIRQQNGNVLQAKNSSGTAETWMWPRWTDNIMYTNYGSGGWNIRNNSSTNVMFLTNGGNVGIGTTSPSTDWKVDVNGALLGRGEIRSEAGLSLYVGKVGGGIAYSSNYDGAYFWGNDNAGNRKVQIRTYPVSGVQAYFTAGNIGVGTSSPGHKLTVGGFNALPPLAFPSSTTVGFSNEADGFDTLGVYNSSRGRTGIRVVADNTNAYAGQFIAQGTDSHPLQAVGMKGASSGSYVRISSAGVMYYDSSSVKLKKNLDYLREDFYKILKVQPKVFTDKATGEREIGYIAEDFEKIGLKKLINYLDYKPAGIKYEKIPLYLLEIIKDQQKQIKIQQNEIEQLKEKLELLERGKKTNKKTNFWKEIFVR